MFDYPFTLPKGNSRPFFLLKRQFYLKNGSVQAWAAGARSRRRRWSIWKEKHWKNKRRWIIEKRITWQWLFNPFQCLPRINKNYVNWGLFVRYIVGGDFDIVSKEEVVKDWRPESISRIGSPPSQSEGPMCSVLDCTVFCVLCSECQWDIMFSYRAHTSFSIKSVHCVLERASFSTRGLVILGEAQRALSVICAVSIFECEVIVPNRIRGKSSGRQLLTSSS